MSAADADGIVSGLLGMVGCLAVYIWASALWGRAFRNELKGLEKWLKESQIC